MEHFDVIIIGAGLSGIGAGAHLRQHCPDKTFAIFEGREASGGTWDLFRYPGIRSDSDMFTLGYSFRPWKEQKAIADGPSILKYVRETAAEYDLEKEIRYGHRVTNAGWASSDSTWTIQAETRPVGSMPETKSFTCKFLYLCTGYYEYESGFTPDWPSLGTFTGTVVHPQFWPDKLDYADRNVLVIGSGATAITLVPALAATAGHVTMLQRSPTYIVTMPSQDKIANFLRKVLPEKAAYALSRWKNILRQAFFYQLSRKRPAFMKRLIAKGIRAELGENYPHEHFAPKYDPWDQRLCLVPDSDLFASIRDGKASVVTGEIAEFIPSGLRLTSGEEIAADIIVTATGLNLKIMSGLALTVDGEPVKLSTKMAYKGMMYNDVPNLAQAFGYTNASWTLKCDLTSEYVCRLLDYMDKNGYASCVPRVSDPTIKPEPVLDFTSGYVVRALKDLPSQGSKQPWRLHQNYFRDLAMLRFGNLDDGTMEFRRSSPAHGR